MWSAKALEFGGRYLRRAVADGDDVEARGFMMLATTVVTGHDPEAWPTFKHSPEAYD